MSNSGQDKPQTKAARPCAICAKPVQEKYRPFCSKRCADIDLHRWLAGQYAIPSTPDSDEDGDTAEDEARRYVADD